MSTSHISGSGMEHGSMPLLSKDFFSVLCRFGFPLPGGWNRFPCDFYHSRRLTLPDFRQGHICKHRPIRLRNGCGKAMVPSGYRFEIWPLRRVTMAFAAERPIPYPPVSLAQEEPAR